MYGSFAINPTVQKETGNMCTKQLAEDNSLTPYSMNLFRLANRVQLDEICFFAQVAACKIVHL